MRKEWLIAILLGGILFLTSQWAIPFFLERQISSQMHELLKAEKAQVSLSTFPGIFLLAGQVDELALQGEKLTIGSLPIEKISVSGKGIKADLLSLDKGKGEYISSAEELSVEAVISKAALEDFFASKLNMVEKATVSLDKDIIIAQGECSVAGKKAKVTIEGVLLPKDGNIFFHMQKIKVEDSPFGSIMANAVFGDILLLDAYNISAGLDVKQILYREDRIIILASQGLSNDEDEGL